MGSFFAQVLYTIWCLPKLYGRKNICKKQLVGKKEKRKRKGKKQQHR
jgi:hypothetical protein